MEMSDSSTATWTVDRSELERTRGEAVRRRRGWQWRLPEGRGTEPSGCSTRRRMRAFAAVEFAEISLSLLVWVILAMSVANLLFWIYEVGCLGRCDKPTSTHPLTDVQVRILTVDAETLVQQCIDSLPDEIDDVHVIAEGPLSVTGATVDVVPKSFVCDATRKGRALEWGRRNIPCSKEYVLYLDEDTVVTDLPEIPDSDIVQFRERPERTDSLLAYLAEILRMGYQVEQRAFRSLRYPLYAWGGGIAVRSSLESRLDWDVDTLIEDTVFTWRAASREGAEFRTVDTKFVNQAPPTVGSMVRQRRRWIAGAREAGRTLPLHYRLLVGLRNVTWASVTVFPVLILGLFVLSVGVVFEGAFYLLSALLYVAISAIAVVGIRYYGESLPTAALLVVLLPLVGLVHSLGVLVGLVAPPSSFEVTEKIEPTAESANRSESEGTNRPTSEQTVD